MTSTVKSTSLTQETVINKYLETKNTLDESTNPELEVRFGTRNIGKISKNNFDNTIKFLLSKNYNFTPTNKYYLTIKVDDIRVEIDNIINIQNYCKTNQIPEDFQQQGYSFTEKNLYLIDGKIPARFNLDSFNFRINYSTEKNIMPNSPEISELISNWQSKKKFNRLIDRYTLIHKDIPIRVDLSIVRESNSNNSISESNIFKMIPKYEIELEVLNDKVSDYNLETLNKMVKTVSKYVLCGLQNTNFPISYPDITTVGKNYLELISTRHEDIKPGDFIGSSSVTLQISNITENNPNSNIVNIKKNFTVTDKADGDRKLLYINNIGKIYLINTQMAIEFTGAKTDNDELFNTLLDGEHIIHNKLGNYINLYAAFDIYFINKKDVRNLEFIGSSKSELPTNYRWNLLDNLLKILNPVLVNSDLPSPIRIQMKRFYDITETQSLFTACSLINEQIKANQYEYNTDGFIFTPKNFGVGMTETDKKIKNYKHTWEYSFKWKPAEYNTIDFLLTTKKTKTGNEFVGNKFEDGMDTKSVDQLLQYKTVILRVGYDVNKHGFANPCQYLIDDEIPLGTDFDSEDRFKPVKFVPSNPYDPDAGISNIELSLDNMNEKQMFTEENEVIEDNTIVECRYDITRPKGWRWVPLRVRYDKTAEYRAGYKSYGNAYHVAQNNWYSIHNPITLEMITTGENIPNELSQDDIYYNQVKGPKKTKALRDFHNLYVKNRLISNVSDPGNTLIDYAVGKGGDIPKWISAKLLFVFGIDYSRDNIRNPVDGVCARYLKYKQKFEAIPNGLFVYGSSNKNIKDTSAIFSDVGKKITNAVFGVGSKENLGKGVTKSYGIASEGFNISSIQFAIHYMFENNQTLHNFLTNIAECTKIGGYFIGSSFSGKKIFNLLNNIKINETYTFFDRDKKNKLLEITKQYDNSEFSDDISSLGYAIDIFQASINKTIREYLVNYDYLTSVIENYGFVPLTVDELKSVNFTESIGSFEQLYKQMQSDIKSRKLDQNSVGDAFKMTREERDISFLNNYFIYKKVRNVDISDIKNALIKSSEAEQVESVKQSLQAAEVVKQTTEQIEDVIESAESIASKPVTSIKIKPIKSKQPKSTKL
ncbi:mRNA capping enzyme [Chrysochromulina ericina virus CeV-01B]|uniref:mRNA capping enzyme n=1 Tax=Chrysochromulina ericina virus CeV-01B TaxID=3070830 RepID=A0A0N9QQU5_9VIRU|nr:mRNA capping enzyme [Chrysochromulina ericina virus]ALH23208.1 mRNA capping enzyme [Chrysochromulina ericina virus CeV-01B]